MGADMSVNIYVEAAKGCWVLVPTIDALRERLGWDSADLIQWANKYEDDWSSESPATRLYGPLEMRNYEIFSSLAGVRHKNQWPCLLPLTDDFILAGYQEFTAGALGAVADMLPPGPWQDFGRLIGPFEDRVRIKLWFSF